MIEDICINPATASSPASFSNSPSNITGFYAAAETLRCRSGSKRPLCVAAGIIPPPDHPTFSYSSTCRGQLHFFAVYYTAVSLAYTQDAAYWLAAYSQAIDFVQYDGINAAGEYMGDEWSTPPLRGFLRTDTFAGGTVRHLGMPYIGADSSNPHNCTKSSSLSDPCPALDPDYSDFSYEGSLASAHSWAFSKSDLLCAGGFTSLGASGSPFTGAVCASGGTVTTNAGPLISGPIPLTGGMMEMGPQIVHYECEPACACDGSCDEDNSNFERVNMTYDFAGYVEDATTPWSRMSDGSKVPQEIARMGIFLHWINDRSSHFYCTDAAQSGVRKGESESGDYDLEILFDKEQCNFVTHALEHLWEQGMVGDVLAPGSYSALKGLYERLSEFREQHLEDRSEWFREGANVLEFGEVVGNERERGTMYKAIVLTTAAERVEFFVQSLSANDLPPLPGFEKFR